MIEWANEQYKDEKNFRVCYPKLTENASRVSGQSYVIITCILKVIERNS